MTELNLFLRIIILPFLGLFLGLIFAVPIYFLVGLDEEAINNPHSTKPYSLETKIGLTISVLLFIGGFVLAHGILFGWLI